MILAHLDSLPTLPAVVVRLVELTLDPDCDFSEVIRLARSDQSITARILAAAGSAVYGIREPARTLDQAVPLLGLNVVRSIVLAASVFDCFAPGAEKEGPAAFDRSSFWRHALAVGCAARRLAQRHRSLSADPEAAFVAGLLHDLGKVALDCVYPKAYDRVAAQTDLARGDIADAERAILGVDHTVAGRRLAERWRLPRELQDAIWLHHLAPDALPSSVAQPQIIGIVQLADTLAREQRLGYSGNYRFYELSPQIGARLGFDPEELASVAEHLGTDVAEHAALLGLGNHTAESLYVGAITQANQELSRLNGELEQQNRRLALAARYFHALTRFEDVLRDWADAASVVAAMSVAGAAALERTAVLAFALHPDGAHVDVGSVSSAATAPEVRTLTVSDTLRAWLANASVQPGTIVVPAAAPLGDWGAGWRAGNQESPWVLPLVQHGRLIGGLLYGAAGDERARLEGQRGELRAFLTNLGLALGRAQSQAAARRLSEDLAESNRRLQQMQTELLRSRTLSMIAEMAAGAGHELNSPLTVISGRAQMLAQSAQDPETQRVLLTITEKAHECSRIVSELMDFARPRPVQPQPVELGAILTQAREHALQASQLAPGTIRVELGLGTPEQRTIQADPQLVAAVIEELVDNALSAIREKPGTITLRLRATPDPEMVELVVADTGCGMPPPVLQRAFDPFFSHQQAGRRRGLGLPRAYRIVESHGGRIWLESHPDEGTTAHVLLPRVARPQRRG